MNKPMPSIQIMKIENGYLVQSAVVQNPKTGEILAPPRSWFCAEYDDVCECVKQFFPPSLIV